jgi:hypothetical protein
MKNVGYTFEKLKDLTPEIYMNYKKRRLSDTKIGLLYDSSLSVIVAWKSVHGLTNKMNVRAWKSWAEHFPKEAQKKKDKFISLYNKGWKHEHIAKEMDMTEMELSTFKKNFFPHLQRNERLLTAEQKAIAKANDLNVDTVYKRVINKGMDIEEAIRRPKVEMKNRKRRKGKFLNEIETGFDGTSVGNDL